MSRFIVNMVGRLLSLEVKGKLTLDHKQASDLFVSLKLRGPLANDLSWDIALYHKVYCRCCDTISSCEVGLPSPFVSVCRNCVDYNRTWKAEIFSRTYAINEQVKGLPIDIRNQVYNNFFEETNGLQGIDGLSVSKSGDSD